MTTIDWTQPVETCEDPPRPVRVLCTDFKAKGFPYLCAVDYGDHEAHALFSGEGWDTQRVVRLRNIAPPKPVPVLREAWVQLYPSGEIFTTLLTPITARGDILETRRIAWMSDGSPVPGEFHDDLEWTELRAKTEALQAEVDRMRPVVEAAVIYCTTGQDRGGEKLLAAIKSYVAWEQRND